MPVNTNRWNRIRYTLFAPFYDGIARFGAQRRRSIEQLPLRHGERVLIVGAGTGADLAHIPPGVAVTAIDITPAMVNRLKVRARGLGRSVDAQVMDGHRLSYADQTFDAVILHLILAVIPDPEACLREVERVLKPGGRVAVFDKFQADDRPPGMLRRLLNIITNALFTDITRQLNPLIAGTSLALRRTAPAWAGNLFQIALLEKQNRNP